MINLPNGVPPEMSGSSAPPPLPQNPQGTPYGGGFSVRCPRCSNIVNTRYCSFCGMDLSACYTVQIPGARCEGAPYPQNMPYYGGAPYYGNPARPSSPPPVQGFQPAAVPPVQTAFPPLPGARASMSFGPPALPKEKHTLRNTLLICGVSLACILLFTGMFFAIRRAVHGGQSGGSGNAFFPPASSEDYYYPQGVSLKEYQQLKEGMSYALVSQIIGGDGELQQSGETLQGDVYYTYLWYGEDNPYALVFITFTDGAVTTIANEGLTNDK